MHNPRGSNNRLNEQNANRNNGDRLFNSQNNNRGGYNVGDKGEDAFDGGSTASEPGAIFNAELNLDQYSMIFFSGSILGVEWTVQHGCGGNEQSDPHKVNCNMVMQFTCNTGAAQTDPAMQVELKDGRNTNTPDTAGSVAAFATQRQQNDNNGRGRHESEAWYYECERRVRNKGLFLADQYLNGDDQTRTRQNPNGDRRGLECPEERDYYPWWKPSPWMDIAYLTDTIQDCSSESALDKSYNVTTNSMNVKSIGKCVLNPPGSGSDSDRAQVYKAQTQAQCANVSLTVAGATWQTFTHNIPAPQCLHAEWSRVNHLGNGRNNQPLQHNWTIPGMDKLGAYTDVRGTPGNQIAKCVLRLRYNISTDDYDPRNTDYSQNDDPEHGIRSPVEENPTVDVGLSYLQGLKLAMNTNQFGRTFQDRSHTFYIKTMPTTPACPAKVHNLNVRGKRGNIVQVYPSVEYDFQPNQLEIGVNDCIHIQWTGSNTHNNGNPAGDGQAGDAGEGTLGTDRHNIQCLADRSRNYPVAIDKTLHNQSCMFTSVGGGNANFWGPDRTANYFSVGTWNPLTTVDAALWLGSSGYYTSQAQATAATTKLDVLLNNAPASLVGGILMKPTNQAVSRTLHYMCSRNNNFSNRSQKGSIRIL